MASGTSSLESNESTGSISHNYVVTNDRQHSVSNQLSTLPMPLEYEVLTPSNCFDKQKNYAVSKSHPYEGMNSGYDSLTHPQYDVMNKQANEGLKQQCEKALHDLNTLRRQHSETTRRCEHAMKELEYFRGQHRAAMNQLEVSAQEANSLRGKYGDLLNDNQRLEREVQHLHDCATGEGDVGSSDTALMHTLRKYDELKEEYDCFQKRYEELITTHAATMEKLQMCQEENNRLKAQCHDLTKERNTALSERAALKQQCGAAVRQWERERAELRAALARGAPPRPQPELKRLTDERNAAMHEYTLIMSERDTVHKEMEKLSDDLQASLKRTAALEAALQGAREERRALALQAETLRREITSALQDRDRALKECSDLKAPQNAASALGKSRQDNSAYHHLGLGSGGLGKDGCLNGPITTDTSMEKLQGLVGMVLNPREKEHVDNLEQANQELERLRKTIDKLQGELTEAHQEAEVSKRRRDWAFSERDKIVLERESIRTLCDRLRKERDRAVSDLAEALRDSDDIKKQRNEASKELKELKERLESELEKEPTARGRHNHSRDSAIDTDMQMDWQEWEWEALEVEVGEGEPGVELGGGREEPCFPNDYAIYVTAVQKGSPADGKLRVNDRLVSAGGMEGAALTALGPRGALAALRAAPRVSLQRRRAAARTVRLAPLAHAAHIGIAFQQGLYISKISPGSLAAKEGTLAVGDRVININNRSIDGLKTVSDAMLMLKDCQYDTVSLTVLRQLSSSHLAGNELPHSRGREASRAYAVGRMVNSCSQTEEMWELSELDRRYVYRVAHNKMQHERGTWDMIRGKIESVTWRGKSKDKQNRQSMVPETDAIAELDSVIDSYHGKSSKDTSTVSGVLKRSKRRSKDQNGTDSAKNNGGTWPKARSNVILQENPTGTIVQPRSKKERMPIDILLSPPTKLQSEPQRNNVNRNSNPIPLAHQPLTQVTTPARHSVYKSIESAVNSSAHFPKSAPLSIHNPFPSPNIMNFDKMRRIDKDKMGMSDYSEHDLTPNRLSLALNPSDDSLDYQPVPRNCNKSPHSLDYIGVTLASKGPSSLEFVPNMSLNKSPNSIEYGMKGHSGKDTLDNYYSPKKSSPKSVNKYPSDSDSFGPESINSGISMGMTGTLPTQSRLQSQFYRGPFVNTPHVPTVRYPHPASPTIPQSQSGESIGVGYEIPSFASHSHNMSDLQPISRTQRTGGADHYHTYEGGTFPRKKENQRFRIPSNPSVTSKNSAGKLSTGSIERSSERNSPMPTFHVEVLSPGRGAKQLMHKGTRNSMPEYCGIGWNKPLPGELRRVHIDKSQQTLGIQISCPPGSGGVFVSTVNEHSIASQVGLQVGDQLLEVCGINMRSATYKLAANVLRQCGNSITMLVQYSPEKYNELEGSGSSSSGESSRDDEVSISGSPTPRNSPGPQQSLRLDVPTSESSRQQQGNKELPRFLLIELRNCSDLGISLVGGNAVGIFVHSVQMDSPAYNAGLRTGDQILEYNNADLRNATAEQAALELAKPAGKVSVLVRHDMQQYQDIKDKAGDALYVRAGFERGARWDADPYALAFRRDEVLFVDNTLFNGAPGLWRAWQLDHKGNKQQWGTIPSKFKVEEMLRRSVGSLEGNDAQARRGSTSARRSFFRRKKHRDSKELASFSSTNLGWLSDSGTLTDDLPVLSYQRVERLDYPSHRPVVVLGPLWECVVEKVVTDFPAVFCRVTPEPVALGGAALERALAQGTLLEPRKRNHYLQCISLQAIRDVCDKGMHCILDISVRSIEKLHRQQMYPIVLLIRFKSTKQIKEVKDTRYPMDKVSAKAAKEMYEHALKLENEYRNYISAVIPAGVNIAYMCTQLKAAVDEEQSKTLWVPSVQA